MQIFLKYGKNIFKIMEYLFIYSFMEEKVF